MRKMMFRGMLTAVAMMVFTLFTAGTAGAAPQEAQPQGQRGHAEEIRSMKIAFFADALKLSPEESQKFWPVYNQYWEERREVGRKRRDLHKVIREGRAGDAQFKELLWIMDAERRITGMYITKFREVLPAAKAARVFVADEDFKNFLVRRAAGGK